MASSSYTVNEMHHRDKVEVPRDGSRPIYEMRLHVRQYEVDILGHVNNAVYVNYLEQAAIEHVALLGFDTQRLADLGGTFVVRRHEIDYLGGAVAGDDLIITTWPDSLHGSRAVRCYEIRHATTGRQLVTARTLWVWIDKTGRPRPVPQAIVNLLASLMHPPPTSPNTMDGAVAEAVDLAFDAPSRLNNQHTLQEPSPS